MTGDVGGAIGTAEMPDVITADDVDHRPFGRAAGQRAAGAEHVRGGRAWSRRLLQQGIVEKIAAAATEAGMVVAEFGKRAVVRVATLDSRPFIKDVSKNVDRADGRRSGRNAGVTLG